MRNSAVFVWSDRALYIGDRSETAVHAHHAIEWCVALDDQGIRMRSPDGLDLNGAESVVVRSAAKHQLSIPGPKVAVLYVDPHTAVGAGLHRWLHADPMREVRGLGPQRARLRQLFSEQADLATAGQVCSDLLGLVASDPPRPAVDWRIRKVRRFVDEHLDSPPTQAQAATHVGLSASRVGHVFKAQVGLPMRRYVLWMRLRSALTHALDGVPMSDAAHLAGFSDAAHFTRTCQRMFGLPPTAFAPVDAVFVET